MGRNSWVIVVNRIRRKKLRWIRKLLQFERLQAKKKKKYGEKLHFIATDSRLRSETRVNRSTHP